jgi:hypothetical protein
VIVDHIAGFAIDKLVVFVGFVHKPGPPSRSIE